MAKEVFDLHEYQAYLFDTPQTLDSINEQLYNTYDPYIKSVSKDTDEKIVSSIESMINIINSSHPLSYLAIRQLTFYSYQDNFIIHSKLLNLDSIIYSLLKIQLIPLRYELLNLLDVLTTFDNFGKVYIKETSNSNMLINGFEKLVDMLCLPLNRDNFDSFYIERNSSNCIYRSERLMILNILNRCIMYQNIRIALRNKKFDSLFIYNPDQMSSSVSLQIDSGGGLVPLLSTFNRNEKLLYRSIVAVLHLST